MEQKNVDNGVETLDAPSGLGDYVTVATRSRTVNRFTRTYATHKILISFLLIVALLTLSYGGWALVRESRANPDKGAATSDGSASGQKSIVILPGKDQILTINPKLNVQNDTAVKGDLRVTGNTTLNGLKVNGDIVVAHNGTFGGDVTANNVIAQNIKGSFSGTYSGNGSALTGLNASNITSGTLSDARLSANVTVQGNTFNNANELVKLDANGALPSASGVYLTDINAATLNGQAISYFTNANNFIAGTLSDARLSTNVALLDAGNTFTNTNTFTGNVAVQGTVNGQSAVFSNDVAALTFTQNGNIVCDASGNCGVGGGGIGGSGTANRLAMFTGPGAIGDSIITQSGATVTVTGALVANSFQGNGSALTNLNASNLANGTVADGRLSSNVPLLSAVTNTFTGNIAATAFTGSGAGVTGVNAAQLNSQAASYYTNATNLSTGTLADGRLSANVTLAGNTFNGTSQLVQLTAGGLLPSLNGSNVSSVNASALQGFAASYFTNATNLSSGTVADARLSSNVALLNSSNTFIGAIDAFSSVTATNLKQNGNNVCDTSGNCSGVGGGVTTAGGMTGTIALFSAGQQISNSIITQASTTVSVAGTLVATALQGNGSAITNLNATNVSSGTLAVSFGGTGAGSFTSNGVIYGNGSSALQVTPAGTTGQCLVATTGAAPSWLSCVSAGSGGTPGGAAGGDLSGTYPNPTVAKLQGTALSTASLTSGDFLLYNGTNWINHSLSGDITVTGGGVATIGAGTVTNAKLVNSSLTVTAGNGLAGGGSVALGGSTSVSVAYGTIANTAVQGNTTLVCASGTGNLSGGGGTITLGGGGSCGNVNTVASPTFTSIILTNPLAITSGGTGAATFTSNGVLYGNGTGALQPTAVGTTGDCLVGNTAAAPTWASCTAAAGGATPGGPAGGDLSGTYPNPTIAKFQGSTLTITTPAAGQVLQFNGLAFVNASITNANLTSGAFGAILGTGALASGSIASGFGAISTGNNITTTVALQGATVTATGALQGATATLTATGSLTIGTASAATGQVAFKNAGNSGTITLQGAATAGNFTITLPAETGTVCTTATVCAGYASGGGSGVTLQASTPGSPDTGNFNVSGTGIAATFNASTGLLAPLLDTASAVALNLGTTNATAINLNQNTTLAGGKTLTVQGLAKFQNAAYTTNAYTFNNGVTGATPTIPNSYLPTIVVRDSQTSYSRPLFFGYDNGSGTGWASYLTAGACGSMDQMCFDFGDGATNYTALQNNGTTLNIGGGPDGNFTNVTFGNSGIVSVGTLQAATFQTATLDTPSAVALNLGTTNAASINLNQNTTLLANKTLTAQGVATFQDATNSTSAFRVNDSTAGSALVVDTTHHWVGINNATPVATLDVAASSPAYFNGFEGGTMPPFTTDDATVWGVISTPYTYAGGYAAVGDNTSGQPGTTHLYLTKTLNAPGTVSFYYNCGMSWWNGFSFQIDGGGATGLSNCSAFTPDNSTWTLVSFAVAAGTHTFTWTKSGPGNGGSTDRIDNVMVTNVGVGTAAVFNGGGVGIGLGLGNAPVHTLDVLGDAQFMSSSNSTTAFQVQNAAGNNVFSVDTTGAQIVLGKPGASGVTGKLVVNNATNANTVTITSGTTSSSYQLTLPTALSGVAGDCLKDTTGAGVLGFSSCGVAGVTLQATTPGTADTGNFNISGSGLAATFMASTSLLTPVLDTATAAALNIGTTNATAINLNQNTTLASGKTFTVQGSATFQNATNSLAAFAVKDSSGAAALSVDTTNRWVGIGNATPAATLDVVASTPAYFNNFESGLLSPFTISGTSGQQWSVTTSGSPAPYSGSYLAKLSPVGGGLGTSNLILTKTLSGAGNVSFWYQCTSYWSGFTLQIDSGTQNAVPGCGGWNTSAWLYVSYGVAAGTHTFTWSFDGANTNGGYTSMSIDDVNITNVGSGTAAIFNGGGVGIGLGAGNAPAHTLDVLGDAQFMSATNSATALVVQNASAVPVLSVDTINQTLTVRAGTDTATLGSELYATNNFATDWGTTTGWNVGTSTQATHQTGNTNTITNTTVAITSGNTYQVGFTLGGACGLVTDTLTATIGSQTLSGAAITGTDCSGVHSYVVTATGTNKLAFTPTSTWLGTISSVTIKQITGITNPALTIKNTSGVAALEVRSSGDTSNIFIGLNAGENDTSSGTGNTALGTYSLQSNTVGYSNTALGSYSLKANTTGVENTALGSYTLQNNTTGNDNVALGTSSLGANTTGFSNSANGSFALQSNTTGFENTASGFTALQFNSTGYDNVALGTSSLQANTTGYENSALGAYALKANTTGYDNAATGAYALFGNTTGTGNSASGSSALLSNTTGLQNTATGFESLGNNTTGSNNTAEGFQAGYGDGGAYAATGNSVFGYQAGLNLQSGANYNTLFGYSAGSGITTGAQNVLLGYNAGTNLTTGSNNVLIGQGVSAPVATGSNQLQIGVGISGDLSTGTMVVKTTTNSTTAFQTQDSSGTALLVADTTNMKVTVVSLVVNVTLTVNGHIVSGGIAPTIAAGTAACTTPTVSIAGTDTAGLITVTTGTGCTTGGKLATITYNTAFGAAPRVSLTPAETHAAGLHNYVDSATISTTAFDIDAQAADTIASTTTYKWYYQVIQ